MALLLGALTEAGADYARTKHGLLKQVFDDLRAIETVFTEKISNAPDLKSLKQLVQSAVSYLAKGLPAEEGAGEGAAEGPNVTGGVAQTVVGAIRSRDDVKKLLDQICEFLQKTEPSNPAPILLNRARRLLDKGFLDIIQELMPDSLSEVEKLAGSAQKTVESTPADGGGQ
jgi:type VI secretion system protein ImpA